MYIVQTSSETFLFLQFCNVYVILSLFFDRCMSFCLLVSICCLCFRYCTGGIRCEMASAYIRSKGAGFENVFQVSSCRGNLFPIYICFLDNNLFLFLMISLKIVPERSAIISLFDNLTKFGFLFFWLSSLQRCVYGLRYSSYHKQGMHCDIYVSSFVVWLSYCGAI